MKYVLASGNKAKLAELKALLATTGIDVVPQSAYDVPEAVEDGVTFTANAIIKARHASALTGLPAIADDSGLEVDALGGEPGVYSARYAGESASDLDNVNKLLSAMTEVPDSKRTARFHCVIALVQNADDTNPEIFHGTWDGLIARSCQGENGFGYDPVFYLPEFDCTSAQLAPREKNRLSHRAKAMGQLKSRLL